ncbi:hypothetical protein GE107_05905 [Cohnella sp. CFH 77786]|uniref:hypothetical protein n=1 Tax=Cohnella sp. CFH 77786 TaxID=2662265 RepID=UPI001C60CB49|nr:hypothetical protein [Cohnella sp. CFH 77786]MBW5445596.1 hypothetical protein [Cohnella sp. CFH 77786]
MNRVAGVVRMHGRDKWTWLYLPWAICLVNFAATLILGVFIGEPDRFNTGGVFSIFVYVFISGMITLKQTFPFALGMGIRRADYFLGTSAMSVFVSAITAALLILLSAAEARWTDGWGIRLHYFHLPFFHEGPEWQQTVTFFLLLQSLFFAGFIIASIHRRFGRAGMYVFFSLLFLIFAFTPLLLSYYDRWDDIGRWVQANIRSLNDLAPWMVPLIGLCGLGSYAMLRRSTV